MSDAAITRIEDAITRLAGAQAEVCTQVAKLADRVEELEAGRSGEPGVSGAPSRKELLGFLDQFRAGEAFGEASLGAWLAVSDTACLRGGLRTVQMREGMHAQLLEQRIKELGGSLEAEIPEELYQQVMRNQGDAEKGDVEKLQEFVSRFSDIDAALKPIYEMADRLDSDPETQSLLRTIVQDERSTLEFLTEACQLLSSP